MMTFTRFFRLQGFRSVIFTGVLGVFSSFPLTGICEPREILIDTVLASVAGTPITLRELEAQYSLLYPSAKRTVASAEQVAQSPELKKLLEMLINQKLIEAEAEKRKIKVSVNDVERYIDQVARQNNLSRSDFELALKLVVVLDIT